jgi:predicted lipoprotein
MTITGNRRRVLRIGAWVAIAGLLATFWFTGLLATVKPIADAKSLAAVAGGGTAFDRVAYVDGIWHSRVVPTVEQKSLDINTLVSALEKNPGEASREYGNDVGGAYNFLVRFSGTVTAVDTKSLTGSLTVSAPFQGGALAIKVLIGPIILGTALRDALGFITFEQFTNQMQYGAVSDELNTRVMKNVVSQMDLGTIAGKKVSIDGAFTYDGSNARDLQVTPVIVRIE